MLVWFSDARKDSSLLDADLRSDWNVSRNEDLIELSRKARRGDRIDASDLPKAVWGEMGGYRAHHYPNYWPELSEYASLWLISASLAKLLNQFDLGNGTIAPVSLQKADKTTPHPGEWFLWNVGNVKNGFLKDHSKGFRTVSRPLYAKANAQDHDLKFADSILAGPDVWYDESLFNSWLFSQDLGSALIGSGFATEKAGLGNLMKCDVVPAS